MRLEIWHNQIMRTNSGTTRIEVIVPNLKWHWVAWFTVIVHQLSSEPSMLSCSVPSPVRLLSRGVASGLSLDLSSSYGTKEWSCALRSRDKRTHVRRGRQKNIEEFGPKKFWPSLLFSTLSFQCSY